MKEDKEVLNVLEEIEKDLKTIANDVKILESIAEQGSSAMYMLADNSNYLNTSNTSVSLYISILAILSGIFAIFFEMTANIFFLGFLSVTIFFAFFTYAIHSKKVKRLSNNLKDSVEQAERILKKYKNEPYNSKK